MYSNQSINSISRRPYILKCNTSSYIPLPITEQIHGWKITVLCKTKTKKTKGKIKAYLLNLLNLNILFI